MSFILFHGALKVGEVKTNSAVSLWERRGKRTERDSFVAVTVLPVLTRTHSQTLRSSDSRASARGPRNNAASYSSDLICPALQLFALQWLIFHNDRPTLQCYRWVHVKRAPVSGAVARPRSEAAWNLVPSQDSLLFCLRTVQTLLHSQAFAWFRVKIIAVKKPGKPQQINSDWLNTTRYNVGNSAKLLSEMSATWGRYHKRWGVFK